MGKLFIPSEKNRHKVVQHRKRCEREQVDRDQQQLQRDSRSLPSPATVNSSQYQTVSMSDEPKTLEVKIVQSAPGVLVIECTKDNIYHAGILYAENSANGAPGIAHEEMEKFKESVNSFVNLSLVDQWTSPVCDRQFTTKMKLRDRNYKQTCGRLVCSSCLEAVGDREKFKIPRSILLNRAKRKVRNMPAKDIGTVIAHEDGKYHRGRVDDEPGYDSTEEHLINEKTGYSSDTSTISVLGPKKNKRKAYIPVGACSILVPAGVDLFEQDYDPLPGPSTGFSRENLTLRSSHESSKKEKGYASSAEYSRNVVKINGSADAAKVLKEVDKAQLVNKSALSIKNREEVNPINETADSSLDLEGVCGDSAISQMESEKVQVATIDNYIQSKDYSADKVLNSKCDHHNMQHSATARNRFKSEKIRNAFSTEYTIKKSDCDALHLTFVRHSYENAARELEKNVAVVTPGGVVTANVNEVTPSVAAQLKDQKPMIQPLSSSPPCFLPHVIGDFTGKAEAEFKANMSEHGSNENRYMYSPQISPIHSSPIDCDFLPPISKTDCAKNNLANATVITNISTFFHTSALTTPTSSVSLGQEHHLSSKGIVNGCGLASETDKSSFLASNCQIHGIAAGEKSDPARPPIKIVLKSVRKVQSASPNSKSPTGNEFDTSFFLKCAPGNKTPHFNSRSPESVASMIHSEAGKSSSGAPHRRSDTGCPPMIKATGRNVSKLEAELDEDADDSEANKNVRKSSKISKNNGTKRRKSNAETKSKVKVGLEGEDASDNEDVKPTVRENVLGLQAGEVVWAKNGTDAYWPGRVHCFRRVEKQCGASIVWFGVDTYSPFIALTKIENFIGSYAKRFNPKRTEQRYHKAVASAIVACYPAKGYFEDKLSSQVHKRLCGEEIFDLNRAKVLKKRRKRPCSGVSSSKKKLVKVIKCEVVDGKSEAGADMMSLQSITGSVAPSGTTENSVNYSANNYGDADTSFSDDHLVIDCDSDEF